MVKKKFQLPLIGMRIFIISLKYIKKHEMLITVKVKMSVTSIGIGYSFITAIQNTYIRINPRG
jgi:hypothetical protein